MPDWAASGRVKIERAKEHIGNLETEITTFGKRDPYVTVPDIDAQTGDVVVRVNVRERPDPRWGAIAGDAVHNLRSALNVLWRIVYPATVRDRNRRNGFPIYGSAEMFETRSRGKKQGAAQRVMDVLKALKPYKGGNDLLWMLEVVNNTDKHQLLIPVFMNFGGGLVTLTPEDEPPIIYQMTGQHSIHPIEDGAILFRILRPTRAGLKMKVDVQITLPVAFAQPEIVEGQPIVTTLHQLAGVVDGVAETFTRAGLLT